MEREKSLKGWYEAARKNALFLPKHLSAARKKPTLHDIRLDDPELQTIDRAEEIEKLKQELELLEMAGNPLT